MYLICIHIYIYTHTHIRPPAEPVEKKDEGGGGSGRTARALGEASEIGLEESDRAFGFSNRYYYYYY